MCGIAGKKSGTFPIILTYGVLGGKLREGEFRNSGMVRPLKESSTFFLAVRIMLLTPRLSQRAGYRKKKPIARAQSPNLKAKGSN